MDATPLVSAWNVLVVQLAAVFTEPTAQVWRQIALGWVLHRGPATVTGIYRTLGHLADRHWTVYHKFFYRAAWSLERLSYMLLQQVIFPMIEESGVMDTAVAKPVGDFSVDDTTAARAGKHVAHAGWYKDASASGPSHKGTVIHWAHNWIVGAVTLRLPKWPQARWVLPAMFSLYRKRPDCDRSHPFRTRQTLAAEMVCRLVEAVPQVQWRVAADGQYATRPMVRGLPSGVNLVSRIRRDASIYAVPSRRRPAGRRGRPRKKGRQLPSPRMLARRRKGWRTITVQYQGRCQQRHVLGVTCLWYHVCHDRPIRLVIARDPSGKQPDDYLFCTDATVSEEEIVQRYIDRWGVEESIFEAKQFMGFESTRGWCSKTVNRQAPLAMVLTTLVKSWYAGHALDEPLLQPEVTPWRRGRKERPSFADMLRALRQVLWHDRIFTKSRSLTRVRQIVDSLAYGLFAAA